ncbi:MAG: hypothetical protein JZD40_00180 [Sulfolobus sp.]|nr:hypothetical protein [Sulfolobus sp.]
MISLSRIRVSSYVNCLARSQGLSVEDPLVTTEAFLIAYKNNEFLDMFIFSDRGILLQKEDYVSVDGTVCEPYLKIFSKYDRKTIIDTAKYLWKSSRNSKTIGKEEIELLKDLGIYSEES